MSFWARIKEIMIKPKNPRIRALENKLAKAQEQLKKYEANTVVDAPSVDEEEASPVINAGNYTEFQFVLKDTGEYVAVQTKPEFKMFKLGDTAIRAEFSVKKLLAHGDILPKRDKK